MTPTAAPARQFAVYSKYCGHIALFTLDRPRAERLVNGLAAGGQRQFRVRVAAPADRAEPDACEKCEITE